MLLSLNQYKKLPTAYIKTRLLFNLNMIIQIINAFKKSNIVNSNQIIMIKKRYNLVWK